ncbi:hypothetical protein [Paenibacillus sp. NFR01]|uniref:hypothetical protein n=1 Tax=Paenibacillus sp. NFR01 TaxID=1566279 RepID=UPI0008B622CD|nr:hypothetical protein [Paenibacillus sp. NFR01]SEU14208.1 hypothetical protein SAMN03159358_3579 [Paenibacillus sp. NFR01]
MRVIIAGEIAVYTDVVANSESIIEVIQEKLDQKQMVLSHIVADGLEIYSEIDSYLSTHLSDIEEVIVVGLSLQEALSQNMISAVQYVERATPEVEVLINQIIQGSSAQGWETFAELAEGLEWMLQFLSLMENNQSAAADSSVFTPLRTELEAVLGSLQEAMNNEDIVLIADVLKYELIPYFSSFQKQINPLIDNEDASHDTI